MNALANPQVGKFLNDNFVSSFQRVATFRIVGKQKQGGNVASYFCAPDGRVLHCVAGPVNAQQLLREAQWVVETTRRAMKECKGYGAAFKAIFRRAHAALVYDGSACVGWCQFGPPDELPRIKHRRVYLEGLAAPPDWRITCFFVDKKYRGKGVAAAALEGALQEIARLGGGTVESYPEDAEGRSASAAFLHNGTVAMFERRHTTIALPPASQPTEASKLVPGAVVSILRGADQSPVPSRRHAHRVCVPTVLYVVHSAMASPLGEMASFGNHTPSAIGFSSITGGVQAPSRVVKLHSTGASIGVPSASSASVVTVAL